MLHFILKKQSEIKINEIRNGATKNPKQWNEQKKIELIIDMI